MALSAAQLEQQKKQAEELLFSGPETLGLVKGLFFGHFNAKYVFPYPQLPAATQATVDQAVAKMRKFCDERIDPAAIDRNRDIPQAVIDGLAEMGVLGMAAPPEHGGQGFPARSPHVRSSRARGLGRRKAAQRQREAAREQRT